jgi:hypothetical protein
VRFINDWVFELLLCKVLMMGLQGVDDGFVMAGGGTMSWSRDG